MIDTQIPSIGKIAILDDNPTVQEAFMSPIEDADRIPILLTGPLGTLDQFLSIGPVADAAISDYQLSPGNYASFDGATLVSEWYKRRFPAILCTTFDKANVARFRVLRRWIPIIMAPHELDSDSLMSGLELVQKELQDDFSAARRPWRALVRFVEYDEPSNTANAKLPGWSEEVVAFRAMDLPDSVKKSVKESFDRHEEYRCFAMANLGSESNEDLYVSDWETRSE
ncbi:MAG: hypothetical protein Q7T71_04770 [Herbiconiux sp.]|nr:hypothetical protein [Herbiconiux sp.]